MPKSANVQEIRICIPLLQNRENHTSYKICTKKEIQHLRKCCHNLMKYKVLFKLKEIYIIREFIKSFCTQIKQITLSKSSIWEKRQIPLQSKVFGYKVLAEQKGKSDPSMTQHSYSYIMWIRINSLNHFIKADTMLRPSI